MLKRQRNQHPFPSEEAILESVRLYEEGWTLRVCLLLNDFSTKGDFGGIIQS